MIWTAGRSDGSKEAGVAKRNETDLKNLKLALEKKEIMIHQYESQIQAFEDPQINMLLEGFLHNERANKAVIQEWIER